MDTYTSYSTSDYDGFRLNEKSDLQFAWNSPAGGATRDYKNPREVQVKSLQWKDEYTLGIPAIDLQHRRIFDCFVRILAGPAGDDRLRAEVETLKLLGLVQAHFRLEEKMMRDLHYPGLERHMEEHRQFLADIHHLAESFLRVKRGVSADAVKVVQKWLTQHILTSDKHYLEYFSDPLQLRAGRRRGPKPASAN